jgi:hypothetical protein
MISILWERSDSFFITPSKPEIKPAIKKNDGKFKSSRYQDSSGL